MSAVASAVGRHSVLTAGELEDDLPKQALYSLLIVPEHPERLSALRRWLREWDAEPDTAVVVSHDGDALAESGIAPLR